MQEEHVVRLIKLFKPRRIVWEFVTGVSGARVPKKDTLHLAWKVGRHFRVVTHDVAVAGVGDEDKLALRKCLKHLFQQEFADGQGGGDVAKVEGTGVERPAGVVVIDELHVVSGDLFGSCRL